MLRKLVKFCWHVKQKKQLHCWVLSYLFSFYSAPSILSEGKLAVFIPLKMDELPLSKCLFPSKLMITKLKLGRMNIKA